MTEIGIRLSLLNGGLELSELRLCLGELLIEVRRRNDRENVAFLDLAADVYIADTDIACCPGKKRCAIKGRHIARQLDNAGTLLLLHSHRANDWNGVPSRLQRRHGIGFAIGLALGAKADQQC